MTLDRGHFTRLVGPMNELLQREVERREKEARRAQEGKKLLMHDLKELAVLGVGAFGRVKLVLHEATDTTYALKAIRKGQVIAMKQVAHVMD